MWYPSTVTVPISAEVVTIEQARDQVRADTGDGNDTNLTRLINMSRQHVEKVCGVRLGSQTIVALCDSFDDLARLPEAPVTSITSITYIDQDGATQTLATSVYELRAEGLETAVVLKYGQSWPSIRLGSRITMTAVVGFATAEPAHIHAILLHMADAFENREPAVVGGMTVFDALLINHRRNA